MRICREQHFRFLEDELKAESEEFKTKFESPAKRLLEVKGELHVAIFESFHNNGSMVMKFPNTRPLPRKGTHFMCMLLPKEFRSPRNWGDKTYRDLYAARYKGSECVCLYHAKSNDERFITVGFRGIEKDFQEVIDGHRGLILVFAPQFPPLEYLGNLQRIVNDKESQGVASILDAEYKPRSWEPRLIVEDDSSKVVSSQMALSNTTILQGPPGTGKTFTIAQVCAELCGDGKSVLVTALTNRALIELAIKPALSELLAEGKVSKVNLTVDEAKEVKGLRLAKEATPVSGTLQLATFYMSSGFAAEATADGLFDYVIMDEASQAYTAMFAAASKLGKHNLWVGDINQLAPIVQLNPDRVRNSEYDDMIDGLRFISCNREYPVMQLTRTYRLGVRATEYTGIFYDNTLVPAKNKDAFALSSLGGMVNSQGGPSIVFVDMPIGDVAPKSAIATAISMVKAIANESAKKDIAILSHRIPTVVALQKAFAHTGLGLDDILIETVAKIQGLTTDITIFVIPNTGYHHGLERRLFNVATSRAREHTIIIADRSILSHVELDLDVIYFLRKLAGEEIPNRRTMVMDHGSDESSMINEEDEMSNVNVSVSAKEGVLSSTCVGRVPQVDAYQITRVLDGLLVFLADWMQKVLYKIHPVDWWNRGVMNVLLPEQREEALDNGAKGLDDLDFAALISVFIGNFRQIRRETNISPEMSDLAKHAKRIRNIYSHKNAKKIANVNAAKINFHMAVIHQFLDGLGTNEAAVLRAMDSAPNLVSSASIPPHTTVVKKDGITISVS